MSGAWLAPTRRKLALAAGGFLVFPLLLALHAIPGRWDVLDLGQVADGLLFLLLGVPVRAFDALTGSAFASRSEAFLRFPTTIQLAAAATADAVLFYLLACAWVRWRERRAHGPAD
ncbi:MAG TPA: hypothetical protein VF530_17770 [Planctomycetota bacterium]